MDLQKKKTKPRKKNDDKGSRKDKKKKKEVEIQETVPEEETPEEEHVLYDSRFVRGPPFEPREYMVSPTESQCTPPETPPKSVIPKEGRSSLLERKQQTRMCNTNCALRDVVILLQDKIAVKSFVRHVTLLSEFIKSSPMGLYVGDLANVIIVMEFLINHFDKNHAYEEILHLLLDSAAAPPKMKYTTEVLMFRQFLADYFNSYGNILLATVDKFDIHDKIINIIFSIIRRDQPGDMSNVKLSDCLSIMEETQLPSCISQVLRTAPETTYYKLLSLCFNLCSISTISCIQMVLCNIIDTILWRHDPLYSIRDPNFPPVDIPKITDPKPNKSYYEVLDLTGNLLWVLLDTLSKIPNIPYPTPSQNAMWSLRFSLRLEFRKTSHKAIACRNNLAALLVKLFDCFPKLPLLQSGVAMDIAMIAVATEIGMTKTWAEEVRLGTSAEDLTLKKLMIHACCLMAEDKTNHQILKEQKVIEGILHLINPHFTTLSVPWSTEQFTDLMFLALKTLQVLGPALPEEYLLNEGSTRLLMLLNWCAEETLDEDLLLECVKTICSVVLIENSKDIVENLIDQEAIPTLLNVCSYLLAKEPMKTITQNILSYLFVILEKFLKDKPKLLSEYGESCVSCTILILSRFMISSDRDFKIDPTYLISFANFVWETVVWNKRHLKTFIQMKGVFLLLNLIETSPYPVQVILLGLLVDMTDEGDSIGHLVAWRRKDKKRGVLSLLIDIWKIEEKFCRVKRTEDGIIEDVEAPLASYDQRVLTETSDFGLSYSPSIADMLGRARPKIFALYHLLNTRYPDQTKAAESTYYVDIMSVDSKDRVYMPLIHNYLQMKTGEIWCEIYRYCKAHGLIMTSFDGDLLSSLLDKRNKLIICTRDHQNEIIRLQKSDNIIKEKEFYAALKRSRLAPSLDALHELEFNAKCTLRVFQKEKKDRQIAEIIPPSWFHFDNVILHRTFDPVFRVTILSGRQVWIKSEEEISRNSVKVLSDSSISFPGEQRMCVPINF